MLGPISVDKGPDLFRGVHLSFLPTVLETFSATYVESMVMDCPLITTNLPFARETCKDAAILFEPDEPCSAADAIAKVIGDSAVREELVTAGRRRARELPTPRDQYRRIVGLLEQLADRNLVEHVPCLI